MKLAAHLHPQHATYSQIREAVLQVEELGADVAYNWDHFYPLYGDEDGAHFEAWTTLASWAEVTSRIEIGCLVTCNSYRNANLLADMARTVDHISDGRLILGIGSGWFERDYDEFGYEFGTAGQRLNKLGESLPIIEARMAKLNPAPTRKIPVLIGGGGEKKTLQYVARHADVWHFWWGDEWERKNKILDDWCAKIGRDPSEISRSVGVDTDQVDDFDALFAGLAAADVDEVTIGRGGPDYDLSWIGEFAAWRDSL
ncbi:MAG: LLM class F420-dependent oxidoreductase [Acidimicrobiia bacterium]|nr:LLM class F420-dependent oxidoreductase [Acidimicrobiia bacterium]